MDDPNLMNKDDKIAMALLFSLFSILRFEAFQNKYLKEVGWKNFHDILEKLRFLSKFEDHSQIDEDFLLENFFK